MNQPIENDQPSIFAIQVRHIAYCITCTTKLINRTARLVSRDVTEPAKIRIRRMRILCAKSVGCGCGFVARTKLVPAITATEIQLSHLKLNSYEGRPINKLQNGIILLIFKT